jgi:hypothetical protein
MTAIFAALREINKEKLDPEEACWSILNTASQFFLLSERDHC